MLRPTIKPKASVYGGLDLASTTDIGAWCLFEPVTGGIQWRFYIPLERAIEIEKRDRVPYRQWIKDGLVTATPGDVIDYDVIKADILQDKQTYRLGAVGYDPWNCEAVRQDLEKSGIEMIQVRQGVASLSAPCKELERRIIEGSLDHAGNRVARWMIDNVEVWTDSNGNIKPVRPKHGQSARKIDGVVALIMAVAVSMAKGPAVGGLIGKVGPMVLNHETGEVVTS